MKKRKKKERYWGDMQEKLCDLLMQSEKDSIRFNRLYLRLYPHIRKMSDIILRRYFLFNNSLHEDILTENVDDIFIKMFKFDEKKSGKNNWFSYIQTISKNAYLDVFDQRIKGKSKKFNKEFEKYDDYPDLEMIENVINDDSSIDEDLDNYRQIIDIFISSRIRDIDCEIAKLSVWGKKMANRDKILHLEDKKSLYVKIGWFLGGGVNGNADDLLAYIKSFVFKHLKRSEIENTVREVTRTNVKNNYNYYIKDNVNYDNYNYIQDDYTPLDSERIYKINVRRKFASDNKYLYF